MKLKNCLVRKPAAWPLRIGEELDIAGTKKYQILKEMWFSY